MLRTCLLAAFVLCLAACDAPNSAAPAPAPPAVDLTGRWTGPEGTYLIVAPDEVKIRNLDGERSFPATHANNSVSFTRDGVTETIRAGDGPATGMKWLADKKDCIVVKSGEGYCRD